MRLLIEKCLSFPLAAKLLLLAGAGALLFALAMQFGLGIRPCILCLWERVPYGLTAALSLLALAEKLSRRQISLVLGLCATVYLASAGLAVFHTGVEQHWWRGTPSCAAQPLQGASIEEQRKALLQMEEPRCDEIPWAIFGLSMANLNIPASLALAFFAAAAAFRQLRKG
jgi:disulfide bond formation protein DsbB